MRFKVSFEPLVMHDLVYGFSKSSSYLQLDVSLRKEFSNSLLSEQKVVFLLRWAGRPLTFSPFDISPDLPVKVYITLALFKALVFS